MSNELNASFQTPIGTIVLTEEAGLITKVKILVSAFPGPPGAADESPVLARAANQFTEYFSGQRREFDLPLRVPAWQPFSVRVFNLLRSVPYGTTLSYGELAGRAGSPRAARAVGQVMAANPLPIVVPCHRVLAAGGLVGGYSGGGGLLTKKWLLDFENGHSQRLESAIP